jgi:hypothetical protein
MTKEAYIRMIGRKWKADPMTHEEAMERAKDKNPVKSGEQIAIAVCWIREHPRRLWHNKLSDKFLIGWLKGSMRKGVRGFFSADPFVARVVEQVFLVLAEKTPKEETE